MKFDFVIGNPPYQEQTLGENKGFAPPVYDKFIDAARSISARCELIHPARFLFNAGSTPKAWNEKMLKDPHFKILRYESDATKIFSNTDIKGGVAISYFDENKDYGAINIFTEYKDLNALLQKVVSCDSFIPLSEIAISSYAYHFTEIMHKEHPEAKSLLSYGHANDLKSNVIEKLQTIFTDSAPKSRTKYAIIVGRENQNRVNKYIKRSYINDVKNFDKYKILIPKASGTGSFGETLAPSVVAKPGMGHTETFFSIGCFDTEDEALNLQKYMKCKFTRALLSIIKKTQMITPGTLIYIPKQDFTEASDINWNAALNNIDKQLYKKYNLTEGEVSFIETNVKEME